MSWFQRWRFRRRRQSDAQATTALLDPLHDRASVLEGDQLIVVPGKVLANIELAMERIDNDIDTSVAIGDFASPEELMLLVGTMSMGPVLLERTLNTAFRIMLNRYPEELVRAPFPPEFDVRILTPLDVTDRQHEVARSLFQLRAGTDIAIGSELVKVEIRECSGPDVVSIFMVVFAMYGLKVSAIQHRTGLA